MCHYREPAAPTWAGAILNVLAIAVLLVGVSAFMHAI